MKLEDYLYEQNGFLYFRNDKGQMQKHPKNRFSHGQLVTTTDKHFSKKNITRLIYPTYVESRGWVYTENYINEQGIGGGCGSSFNEDLYTEITDVKFILIAKRIQLKEKVLKYQNLLNKANDDLGKLEFVMDISVEGYKTATESCIICGQLFEGFNGGNANKHLCTNCLNDRRE